MIQPGGWPTRYSRLLAHECRQHGEQQILDGLCGTGDEPHDDEAPVALHDSPSMRGASWKTHTAPSSTSCTVTVSSYFVRNAAVMLPSSGAD